MTGKMPWLDRKVYALTGYLMLWLGRRAVDRKDDVLWKAMVEALRAGHVDGRLTSRKKRL